MKKISILKTILLIPATLTIFSCSNKNSTSKDYSSDIDTSDVPPPVPETESSYKFTLKSSVYGITKDIQMSYYMSMFKSNPELYNDKIALFEFIYLMDAHDEAAVYVDDDLSYQENNNTSFLTKVGYTNVKQYNIGLYAQADENDTTRIVIGSKELFDGNVYVNVAICGTKTDAEWQSNLDVGSDTTEYSEISGEHDDWKNKNNHKGFDVAANRVLAQINDYINQYIKVSNPQLHFSLTGYSRGAAVANILGAYFEKKATSFSVASSRTYTFATPITTDAEDANVYKTIFNLINNDDLITKVPPVTLGMKRYGIDTVVGVKDTSLEDQYNNDSSTPYFSANYDVNALSTVLEKLAVDGRNNMYKIQENDNYFVKFETTSESGVSSYRTQLEGYKSTFNAMGLSKYVKFVDFVYNESTGKYVGGYYICLAFIANIVFALINNMDSLDLMTILTYYTYVNCKIVNDANILGAASYIDGNSIKNAHLPLAYYYILMSL